MNKCIICFLLALGFLITANAQAPCKAPGSYHTASLGQGADRKAWPLDFRVTNDSVFMHPPGDLSTTLVSFKVLKTECLFIGNASRKTYIYYLVAKDEDSERKPVMKINFVNTVFKSIELLYEHQPNRVFSAAEK
jgi:hypothetical protein